MSVPLDVIDRTHLAGCFEVYEVLVHKTRPIRFGLSACPRNLLVSVGLGQTAHDWLVWLVSHLGFHTYWCWLHILDPSLDAGSEVAFSSSAPSQKAQKLSFTNASFTNDTATSLMHPCPVVLCAKLDFRKRKSVVPSNEAVEMANIRNSEHNKMRSLHNSLRSYILWLAITLAQALIFSIIFDHGVYLMP